MDMALIILKQTLVMALYMAAGWALCKSGKITHEGSRALSSLLVWLVIPVVLLRPFCVDFSMQKLINLAASFLMGMLSLGIGMVFAKLIYRKHSMDCFATVFCNAGFIGIPLVTAAIGEEAVFYLTGVIVPFNILQWTWGASVVKEEKTSFSPRQLFTSPFMIATMLGVVIFVTGLGSRLPYVLSNALDGVADLNAPLAMVNLGVQLAKTDFKSMFTKARLYGLCLVRLWLIPLVTLVVFWLMPFIPTDIRMTVLISMATPVGANVAMYAQLYDRDYPYACQAVALTTIASIAMLPLFIMVAAPLIL